MMSPMTEPLVPLEFDFDDGTERGSRYRGHVLEEQLDLLQQGEAGWLDVRDLQRWDAAEEQFREAAGSGGQDTDSIRFRASA